MEDRHHKGTMMNASANSAARKVCDFMNCTDRKQCFKLLFSIYNSCGFTPIIRSYLIFMWPCNEKILGCFMHFLGSFLPFEMMAYIFWQGICFTTLFSSLCFDAQIVFSVTKNCCSVVLFKKKREKKVFFFASKIGWFRYETGMLEPGLLNE